MLDEFEHYSEVLDVVGFVSTGAQIRHALRTRFVAPARRHADHVSVRRLQRRVSNPVQIAAKHVKNSSASSPKLSSATIPHDEVRAHE
jgi:hypothetical protein